MPFFLHPVTPKKPTISGWPSTNSAEEGTTLTLTCASTSASVSGYEWYKGTSTTKLSGGMISGAKGETLKITVAATDKGEKYHCKASDGTDKTASDEKSLTKGE